MTSLEIAEVTGKRHSDVLEAIRNMESAWCQVTQRKFPLSDYTDSTGRKQPCYILSKTECLYIATKFNDVARAKLILRWEELETGKSTPYYINSKEDEAKACMVWVKGCKELLNLNDSSTLLLMKKAAEPLGLPLPDYVQSKGVMKSAKAFNKLAIKEGFLEEKQRKSSTGKIKSFKSITQKGEEYGENQVSPNNPKETQPLWYESKFQSLLNILLGE